MKRTRQFRIKEEWKSQNKYLWSFHYYVCVAYVSFYNRSCNVRHRGKTQLECDDRFALRSRCTSKSPQGNLQNPAKGGFCPCYIKPPKQENLTGTKCKHCNLEASLHFYLFCIHSTFFFDCIHDKGLKSVLSTGQYLPLQAERALGAMGQFRGEGDVGDTAVCGE